MNEEFSSYKFSEDFHMMTTGKKLGYELTEALLSFLCFYPLLAFIVFLINHSNAYALKGMLLIIPIMAMVYVKRKVNRLILLMASCLAIAVLGAAALHRDLLGILYFMFLLGYGIYFINKRIKNINSFWRFGNLTAMSIFSAVIYSFILYNNFTVLKKIMFIFAVMQLFISIVYFHFSSTNKLLKWEKHNDARHAKSIKTVNIMFSVIMLAMIGIVIFAARQASVFRWLDFINRSIFTFVFKRRNMNTNQKPEIPNQSEVPDFRMPEMDGTPYGSLPFLKYAGVLLKFIGIAAIAIGVIVIIIAAAQLLYKLFIRRLNPDENIESVVSAKDIADNLKKTIMKPALSLRKAIYRNNKDKLRKLYFEAVMSFKKKGADIQQWNTPGEIEAVISQKNNIQFNEITDLYEKYRYTQEEPVDEQVKEMKRKISNSIKMGR